MNIKNFLIRPRQSLPAFGIKATPAPIPDWLSTQLVATRSRRNSFSPQLVLTLASHRQLLILTQIISSWLALATFGSRLNSFSPQLVLTTARSRHKSPALANVWY